MTGGLFGGSSTATDMTIKNDQSVDDSTKLAYEDSDMINNSSMRSDLFTNLEEDSDEGEDVEVLPYLSVFDWTLQDPVGYYREHERYRRLCKQFSGESVKLDILKDMWADRKKYHVLRRFIWPPKQFLKVFYSRGYYDDYEARPTVELHEVTDTETPVTQKSTEIYILTRRILLKEVQGEDFLQGEVRKVETENPQIIKLDSDNNNNASESSEHDSFQKKEWSEFSSAEYNKTKLEIAEVPEGTSEFALANIYPLASRIAMQKPHPITGKQQAVLHYDSEPLAEADYYKSRNVDINGVPLAVTPRRLGIPDDDEVGRPRKKKRTEFEIQPHLPSVTVEKSIYAAAIDGKKKSRKKKLKKNHEDVGADGSVMVEETRVIETVTYETIDNTMKQKSEKQEHKEHKTHTTTELTETTESKKSKKTRKNS